jgi:hypothetical protein
VHGSLDAVLAHVGRREVVPVLPKISRGAHAEMVLPWDPHYPNVAGASAPSHFRYPRSLVQLPSRMTLR